MVSVYYVLTTPWRSRKVIGTGCYHRHMIAMSVRVAGNYLTTRK